MFAMFHSFRKFQNCMVWVCPFFPLGILVFFGGFFFFLALFNSWLRNCFCRNNKREMCNLRNERFQGTGQGLQQHLGQRPVYGWRQNHEQCLFLISQQSYWRNSSEERVETTGDGCVQLYSFKWPCHWRADFPSASSPSQALHPGFSQFAGRPQRGRRVGACQGCWGLVLFSCTPSPLGDLQGSFLRWVCPVRALEIGRCSQSCYPSTLDVGLLTLQAGLGCMEQNALCSLQIREVMLIGVRETTQATDWSTKCGLQHNVCLTCWHCEAGAGGSWSRGSTLHYDVSGQVLELLFPAITSTVEAAAL